MDFKNDSVPLIPADAPDDYIVGYEPDGTPIRLKEFNESLEEGEDEYRRGYYYNFEDVCAKYDAYFKYLEVNPKSEISIPDFEKKFPEFSPVLYHGPNEFQLTEVMYYEDPSIADASQHVNVFRMVGDDVQLKNLFATHIFDGRYILNSKEEIMEAMNNKGKEKEEPWPRMSFEWDEIAENKFQSLNKIELEKTLRQYAKQPDWGVDLPFFHQSVDRTVEIVNEASETAIILYINKDDSPKSDLVETDWHGYAIIVIVFDSANEKLITIDMGGE